MALFEVASVNRLVIENALQSKFADFEDSVLHESARHAGIIGLTTISCIYPLYTANYKLFQ